MKNDLGEQNCYVNVILHVLYHMKEFKEFFSKEDIITSETRWNIFSELKILFDKYENMLSTTITIPEQFNYLDSFNFRNELAGLFKEEKKFEMYRMGDPVDLFLAIVNALHARSLNAASAKYIFEKPCTPQCMAHRLLWINLLEQHECAYCGATSEVLQYDYNYFIYEVYVKEVLTSVEKKTGMEDFCGKLFQCLKELNAITKEVCPEKCSHPKVKKNTFLLSTSTYFCYNLTWRETSPKLTDICKLYFMIPVIFKNKDLFELYDRTNVQTYQLFGLICYWGAHYICFFKSTETDSWIYYDDMNVSKIAKWEDLIAKCIKNRFHPTMLFYRRVECDNDIYLTDTKNTISEESYFKILSHCNRVDIENETECKREESLSEKMDLLREDEWICEKNGCENINKMTTYTCIKCRAINMNILDIIHQRRQYEERKIDIIDTCKRGRSMIPVARKETIPKYEPMISTPKPKFEGNLNSSENIERRILEINDRLNSQSLNYSYNYKPIRQQNILSNIPFSSAGDGSLEKMNIKTKNANSPCWQCEKCMSANIARDYCYKCMAARTIQKTTSYLPSSSPRNDILYNQALKRNSLKESYSYQQSPLFLSKGKDFQKPVAVKTTNTSTSSVPFSTNQIIRGNLPSNSTASGTGISSGNISSSFKSPKVTSTQTDDSKRDRKYYM